VTLGLRSWQEVGELVGITRQHVHNLLKVTRLPEAMREDVRAGGLTEKHARALLRLQAQPEEQSRLWERIHAEKLSGRAAERASRTLGPGQAAAPTLEAPPPVELRAVIDEVLATLVVAGPEEIHAARHRLVDLQRRITGLLEP
jgi:ParB family transcriptional regulator, chromosome partitioning protein